MVGALIALALIILLMQWPLYVGYKKMKDFEERIKSLEDAHD